MASYGSQYQKPLSAQSIRDTNELASSAFEVSGGRIIFAAQNGLDQAATMKVYGTLDDDATYKWLIGEGVAVTASGGTAYAVVTEPWPYFVVSLTAGVQPSSGTATVFVVAED